MQTRTSTRQGLYGVALLICLGAGGCDPMHSFPPVVEESWPFRFHADQPIPSCAVTWSHAHYQRWSELLGIRLEVDEWIDVVAVDDLDGFCPSHAGGCASAGVAISYLPYHEHELIHAYALSDGRSWRLLEEGLARMGACEGFVLSGSTDHSVDIRAIRDSDDWRALSTDERTDWYNAAGDFVGFLVQRYGWSEFFALYRNIEREDEPAVIDEAFARHFGSGYLELVDVWAAEPAMSSAERCSLVRPWPEPMQLDNPIQFDCGPPTTDFWWPGWWSETRGLSRSFSFPEESRVTVNLIRPGGSWPNSATAMAWGQISTAKATVISSSANRERSSCGMLPSVIFVSMGGWPWTAMLPRSMRTSPPRVPRSWRPHPATTHLST